MTRAAIYARFSSEKQREESIEDQVRVCREYAAREGYEIAAIYTDEARSGTNAERRPGFQRMVRYMLHKLAQCEGPDAVVRGFVSRVVVDADGSMWVGFTVNPDGGPPDGRALVRVKSHPGSHCYLTRTPYVIAVRGGFFLSC